MIRTYLLTYLRLLCESDMASCRFCLAWFRRPSEKVRQQPADRMRGQ